AAEIPSGQVLTSAEFVRKSIRYWMLETGLGITVIITAVLGLVVGSVIISQTLYAITHDHLPNYATLMAIGFARWQLALVVVIQSVLVGTVGILSGSALFGRAAQVTQATPIPLEMRREVFVAILVASLASCACSSLLSLRSLFRLDPVCVFHN